MTSFAGNPAKVGLQTSSNASDIWALIGPTASKAKAKPKNVGPRHKDRWKGNITFINAKGLKISFSAGGEVEALAVPPEDRLRRARTIIVESTASVLLYVLPLVPWIFCQANL